MEKSTITRKPVVVVVTGGSGFLGKALVQGLLEEDSPVRANEIRNFDLKGPVFNHDPRLKHIQGDVCKPEEVRKAVRGADLVIHSAAIVDWGTRSEEEVLAVNAGGTENVVKACQDEGVGAMIYTSSLDAVYAGKPLVNIDETIEYPEEHETMYCRSKYLGEKIVLAANNNNLRTCVIRPSDIYGESDPYHMGSLISMARGGFYIRLGNGKARCQHTYVHNVAHAHLKAGEALLNGNTKVPGNVYFITDAPGTNFFTFFDRIVEGAGYTIKPKNLWLPRGLAYSMGAVSEGVAWMARPFKKYYPKFSRFAVTYTCTDFTFTSRKARDHFGFHPRYNEEEAVRRTIEFYRAECTGRALI
jgi:nucleoside-diphosphate-sugar epimerase